MTSGRVNGAARKWASRLAGAAALLAMTAAYAAWQRPGDLLAAQAINYVRCKDKVVALSFDDGPHPVITALLLDTLERYHDHATFCVVGIKAGEAPDLLRRERADGDEVDNHTYTHDNFNKLTQSEIRHEIEYADRDISNATSEHPWLVRPPGGEYNINAITVFARMHRIFALWSVNPGDWKKPPPAQIVRTVLKQVRPGVVVLLHDDAVNTVDALPDILDGLKRRGYRCVTMSQLAMMR